MTHTPAPWTKDTEEHEDGVFEPTGWIDGPNGKSVVRYKACGSHEAEWPNADDYTLALAAPELLAALELAAMELEEAADLFEGQESENCAQRAREARAVIQKARGGK